MKPEPSEQLQNIFAEAYCQLTQRARAPELVASFYPFADLTHTIRSRNGRIHVRVSDLLREAPLPVLQALARLLIGRMLKLERAAADETCYQQFIEQPETLQILRERGALAPADPAGDFYDLDRMFARLNRRYFNNALAIPSLGWSLRSNKRMLGYYDYDQQAIVISRTLDDAYVPPYVVEFLIYHEMLHLKHGAQSVKGKRHYHTAAFRADEARFAQYDEAMDWLDEFSVTDKKAERGA